MKLEFFNCPHPEAFDKDLLPPKPAFITYEPNFELIKKYEEKYKQYENLLIIGHGGSTNCFIADYAPLTYEAKKWAYVLNTTDPDYIFQIKSQLEPKTTLVVAVSKSGETTTQLEALMPFADFPLLMVTGKDGTLREIGEKLKADVVMHPPIGGRYNSFTEVALLPAGICGVDVKGLYEGAKKVYESYEQDNEAWHAASVLYQLEEDGYVDVFMPFYSHSLFPASALIVQLCHESFGKAGRGQTYFAHEAPESQHHTNQRFFGGQKNICGFFTTVDHFLHPTQNEFPSAVHSVQLKGHHLADISKVPLEKSMEFEAQGTMEDAKISGIPLAHLAIAGFVPEEIGKLIAFWQLYTVYASALRKVDPFDQPQVENSKIISFNKRLAFKGLL